MKILSYDIESTTGNHRDGSMCTFGYCVSDGDFNLLCQKDIVMRPYTNRFETKIKLHYEKAFIKSQPIFSEFYEEIRGLFADADLIIGFSVLNDVEFLNNACEIYNLPKITYDFIDVQLLYKTVYKEPHLSGLTYLAEKHGIEYTAHRSDEDARVTLLLMEVMAKDKGLAVNDLIKKYHLSAGINDESEITPCTDGTYSRREMNYLIGDFVERNYRHSRRYKGGLSGKTFAFADELRYGDIDLFRRRIKKIYELNGRVGSIDSSNVFVKGSGDISEKDLKSLDVRNTGKTRITVISEEEFAEMAGELPEIDFSLDSELIKAHRAEIKRQREFKRLEKRRAARKNSNQTLR